MTAWDELHERQKQERRAFIAAALRATNGNRSAAARALGIQRTYLQFLIREFALEPEVPMGRRGRRIAAAMLALVLALTSGCAVILHDCTQKWKDGKCCTAMTDGSERCR